MSDIEQTIQRVKHLKAHQMEPNGKFELTPDHRRERDRIIYKWEDDYQPVAELTIGYPRNHVEYLTISANSIMPIISDRERLKASDARSTEVALIANVKLGNCAETCLDRDIKIRGLELELSKAQAKIKEFEAWKKQDAVTRRAFHQSRRDQ